MGGLYCCCSCVVSCCAACVIDAFRGIQSRGFTVALQNTNVNGKVEFHSCLGRFLPAVQCSFRVRCRGVSEIPWIARLVNGTGSIVGDKTR